MTLLRSVTCHMGSHSVTCCPTQVNTPCLNPSRAGWDSIYLPQRDGRLSWPSWLDSARGGNQTSDLSNTSPTLNHCTTKTRKVSKRFLKCMCVTTIVQCKLSYSLQNTIPVLVHTTTGLPIVLKLSWNQQLSWNFTSCCWEPCYYYCVLVMLLGISSTFIVLVSFFIGFFFCRASLS